jgi:hypothetical protein
MTQTVTITIPYAKIIDTANHLPSLSGQWFLLGHEIVMKKGKPYVMLHWKGSY